MAKKYAALTKKQLIEYFQPYRDAFPDWAVEHDVMLTRMHGPLKQAIWLEALRTGDYRLRHAVNILVRVPDGCSILDKQLGGKHNSVSPRYHAVKWPLVLKAMEEQFLPPIRQPLNVAETLLFAEVRPDEDRIYNINYVTGLAVLNSYLGNAERALYWCGRIEEAAAAYPGRPLADWIDRKRCYALDLQQAIKMRNEREFLSQI